MRVFIYFLLILHSLFSYQVYSDDSEVGEVNVERVDGQLQVTIEMSDTEAGAPCIEPECGEENSSKKTLDINQLIKVCRDKLPEYCEGVELKYSVCYPDEVILPENFTITELDPEDEKPHEVIACFTGFVEGVIDGIYAISKGAYEGALGGYKLTVDEKYREESLNTVSFFVDRVMKGGSKVLKEMLLSPILGEIDKFSTCLNTTGKWEYFCEAGIQTIGGLAVYKTVKRFIGKPRTYKALDRHATELEKKVKLQELRVSELEAIAEKSLMGDSVLGVNGLALKTNQNVLGFLRKDAREARAAAIKRKKPKSKKAKKKTSKDGVIE